MELRLLVRIFTGGNFCIDDAIPAAAEAVLMILVITRSFVYCNETVFRSIVYTNN